MIKINQLTSDVYNKISAGEVVERPCSIVKELIENAIDAGASRIDITIHDGGKSYICVADNGVGINHEYVKTAFLPHATSKIATDKDLFEIATLGFRGEALASIASVSQVELTTRAQDEELGSYITIKGGSLQELNRVDRDNGATFIVKDLFYNTPAREKFLKSNRGEEQEITSLVSNFILANPQIAFSYSNEHKNIYLSRGEGLFDAIYSVYDKDLIAKLLPVEYSANGITIKGFVGSPECTKATRSHQTTIINGRIVNNASVSTAVSQAFGATLMKRTFPVYVLDITMPFDSLDVNVHPNKSDVRFADARMVFSKVYGAISHALTNASKVFSYEQDIRVNQCDSKPKAQDLPCFSQNNYDNVPNSELNQDKSNENNDIINKLRDMHVDIPLPKRTVISDTNTDISPELLSNISALEYGYYNSTTANTSVQSDPSTRVNNPTGVDYSISTRHSAPDSYGSIFDRADYEERPQIVGQIFQTYIIVSHNNCIYLMDQHACHEKMIYDKLIEQLNTASLVTQPLLIPQTYVLAPTDFVYILDLKQELSAMGIEIEEFGDNVIKVSQIPVVLKEFKLKSFVDELLQDKHKLNKLSLQEMLKDRLAITACKAAIKSGDKLNDFEINSLIKMMKNGLPLQCPHGRPAIIKIERKDIDKLFKRIV